MRILLASMPNSVDFIDAHTKLPNLAIASLAGSLPDHDVRLMDLVTLTPSVKKPFLDALNIFRPQILGLSAMTFQFSTLLRIAKLAKEYDPSIKIIAGGYHTTLMHNDIAAGDDAALLDFMIRGEGEKTIAELVAAMERGDKEFNDILGLSWKQGEQWTHNEPRPLQDIETLPLPRRDLRITKGYHFMGMPMDVVETSRGCPFNCKFCSITHMYGHTFRPFPMARIVEDLKAARSQGAKAIFFSDDNLTYDVDHFKALCQSIVENDLTDMCFMTQVSAVGIARNPELVDAMDKANFRIVFVGFESMDPEALKRMNKPTSPEINITAARLLTEHNMGVIAGTIVGYPDDDKQSVTRQIKLTREIRSDGLYLQYLTPYPKTRIRQEMLEGGFVVNKDNFDDYTGLNCNIRTKHLSQKELQRCKRLATLSVGCGVWSKGLHRNYFIRKHPAHCAKAITKNLSRDIFYLLFDKRISKGIDV